VDQVHEVKDSTSSVPWTLYDTHLSQSDISNHIVSTKGRKNLRSTTSQSAGLLRAHHPGLRQRYFSSWNEIWTNGADNKTHRRVNMTACALVSHRWQTSDVVSRTLLHNIRRNDVDGLIILRWL